MQGLPKIALIGYGSMGREIERLALGQGFVITDIFDVDTMPDENADYEFDVALDFTQPEAVASNVRFMAGRGKNIVVGTTGWMDKKDEIEAMILKSGTGLVYGSNFSVGMQMYFRLIDLAASLLNKTEGYDIMIHEMHHRRKKDSPSGTALSIAEAILRQAGSKTAIQAETVHGAIDPGMLHVSSTRGGEIMGTHTVYIDSLADTIELTHRARNRSGLAQGALTAARWIHGKKGFYEFTEVMTSIWS